MDKQEIMCQLQEAFRDVFDDDALVLTESTSPSDIDDWDSLAQISLISAAQDMFDVEFDISEMTSFTDAGSLCDIIYKKLQL